MEEDTTFLRVTNKDIYKELKSIQSVQNAILAQAKYTNGRVTHLENRSIGIWVENNVVKAGVILLFIFLFFIQETRGVAVAGLQNLIGLR